MIGAALVAFQLAGALASPPLLVRDPSHTVRIATVASQAGPMVRPEALGQMFPITVNHDSASWYTLDVWGTKLQVEAGVPVVRVGDSARPLVTPPVVQNGRLLIPLQMVSEVFPGVVPNTRWDADNGELVLFTSGGVTASSMSGPPSTGSAHTPHRAAASDRLADDSRLPPVPVKHHRYTIIVDAGHGGVDNGMTGPIGGGPRIYEKNITLAVSMKLGALLESRGYDVVYTRTTDTLIALDDRGRIANRANGDLFISIHVNAANPNWKDPGGSRGFETYFLSEAHTEDARRVEQMENAAVQYEDASSKPSSDDPLNFILSDMKQNEHLRESSELAEIIQHRLALMHPGENRGVKQAGFRVLVTAYMPAVLVEIGFGTNPREAAFLSDPNKQQAIAAAVADAAGEYLQRYERRAGGVHATTATSPRTGPDR